MGKKTSVINFVHNAVQNSTIEHCVHNSEVRHFDKGIDFLIGNLLF